MRIGGVDYTSSISSWFGTKVVPATGCLSVSIKATGSSGEDVLLPESSLHSGGIFETSILKCQLMVEAPHVAPNRYCVHFEIYLTNTNNVRSF